MIHFCLSRNFGVCEKQPGLLDFWIMKINTLTPMLYTEKIRETVEFYTGTLGFTCPNFVEEWGWATLQCGDIEIMFSLPNAHIPFEKPVFTGTLYFKVDNADEVWEKLKDKTNVCY